MIDVLLLLILLLLLVVVVVIIIFKITRVGGVADVGIFWATCAPRHRRL